ncbi:DUF1015 domain-containing protein [Streptomyces sp. NPDC048290]|uniref:DUF1015 domain-containing protein n=1 Tax=Streptomyces sp. NPDC048290 TaxID=3155811 RepID=UPI00343A8CA8
MNTAGHSEATERRGLELTPFRGLRYDPDRVGSLAAVTSPPYDVVVRPDGLHQLQAADPHNIVRLILPQAETPEARNAQAAATLTRWRTEGTLSADPEPGLYLYEQSDGEGLLQRGIIGALRVTDPEDRIVLPHEDVMPHLVADRAALMRATSANLEPLLLTYRGDEHTTTAEIIERTTQTSPLFSTTTEDGYHHRLWSLTSPTDLTTITTDLARHQALIADGHHRWATYRRLRAEHPSPSPWDDGLVLLVDTARYPLRVRAIHRYLPHLPVPDALAALKPHFRIRSLRAPLDQALAALSEAAAHSNAYLLAGDGTYHLVDQPNQALLARTVPTDRPSTWRTLDATVLHSTLLDHLWQIPEDSPTHIAYIHDTAATVTKAEQDGGTAVLMHPVREELVRDLARQGVTMPRKSTSFGPKPASGLVLRALDL